MKHTPNAKYTTSRWIRKRELLFFMMLPVWLSGLRGLWKECFLPIHNEILRLWKTNGSLWLSQYLACVSRAIVLWVGGERLVQDGPSVRVRLSRSGLPLLLPGCLRRIFHQLKGENHAYALSVIKVSLTILAVYRVLGCAPILKLETVTGPFTGTASQLLMWEIVQVVGLFPRALVLTKVAWTYLSESAGPNYKHSTWSAGLDAIAFLRDPFTWYHWICVAVAQRAWVLILWNLFTIVITSPLVPVLIICKKYPRYLGRLVKLYEARGKVRIIAITDWWTQVLLKPLHLSIFDILRDIPQDGTFDQLAPTARLMSYVRASGAKVFSYDLSAATDRLPVSFQVQVLEAFGLSWAKHWAGLLVVRPWYLEGDPVHYAVGQPMGALSSWASLALCHHCLVQIAAKRVGIAGWFSEYALLGDDIIIADDKVAGAYHALMTSLGVSINLSKSFEMASGLSEFAKRWLHPHWGDLSPMGPGLILAVLRNPRLVAVLIQDALKRDFVISTRVIRDLSRFLSMIRPRKWLDQWLKPILSSVTGPDGGLWNTASGLYYKASWIAMFPHHPSNKIGELVDTLYQLIAERSDAPSSLEQQIALLVSRFWTRADLFRGYLWGVVSFAFIGFSPALWVYYDMAAHAEERVAKFGEMKGKLLRNLYRSWAGDGLDHPSRYESLKAFLQVNFDPDLLNWDRKAAELNLFIHKALPGVWDQKIKDQAELFDDMMKSYNLVVDPYADFDFDALESDFGVRTLLDVSTKAVVPLGYWSPVIKQVIRQRHDTMEAPQAGVIPR
jgi:hypothetical protein